MSGSWPKMKKLDYPLPAKPSAAVREYTGNPWELPPPSRPSSNGSSSNSELRGLRADLQRAVDTADARASLLERARASLPTASTSGAAGRAGASTATLGLPNGRGRSRGQTPASASTSQLPPARGTKRARLDSDSSLSPTSTTSTSSIIDPNHPNSQAAKAGSRAASPSGSALGLSSSRLSSNPLSSSTNNKGKAPESRAGSAAAAVPPAVLKDGTIPGVTAPAPSLPGFRKKRKEASPSPALQERESPVPNAANHGSPGYSTSTLPPGPSSLPPRPAGLPPKPPAPSRNNSYTQAGIVRERTPSAHGHSNLSHRMDVDGMRSRSVSLSAAGSPPAQGSGTRSRSISPLPPKPPPPSQLPEPALKAEAVRPDTGASALPTVAVSSPPIEAVREAPASLPKEKPIAASIPENITSQTTPAGNTTVTAEKPPPVARKGLPPPSSSANNAIKPSPAIQTVQAANGGPPSRPGTPLGRKALPPSVVVSSGLAKSSSSLGKDKALAPSSPAQGTSIDAKGKGKATSPAGSMTTRDREAEKQRKKDKKKRKLAALGPNGVTGSSSGQGKVNGQGRQDSLPPNKQRRIDGSSADPGGPSGSQGLKVKLNGFSLNRGATPSDGQTFAQPAPPRKTVSIPGVADDFSLPSRSLVPAPPPLVLPTPTPSKQADIDEDFDHAKPASQVPYTTFANWVHDYLRSFGEDDLAFLSSRSTADPASDEAGSLYTVPAIGPHYLDAWAALDAELAGDHVNPPAPSTSLAPAPTKKMKPENMTTERLGVETYSLGPLGERIMSAFKGTSDFQTLLDNLLAQQPEDSVLPAGANPASVVDSSSSMQDAMALPAPQISPQLPAPPRFGDPSTTGPTIKEMDTLSFESRLTRELSFLGVIPPGAMTQRPIANQAALASGGNKKAGTSTAPAVHEIFESPIDWAGREDDEISSSLRACQRLLKEQIAINEKRKAALAERVRERIAFQEYEHLRDGLESVIEGAWAKRQRAAQRKAYKDKKDKDRKEKDRDKLEAASLAQSIAALNQPQPLSANLIAALTKRRNLVDGLAHLFPEGGLLHPIASVYEGLNLAANVVGQPPQNAPSVE